MTQILYCQPQIDTDIILTSSYWHRYYIAKLLLTQMFYCQVQIDTDIILPSSDRPKYYIAKLRLTKILYCQAPIDTDIIFPSWNWHRYYINKLRCTHLLYCKVHIDKDIILPSSTEIHWRCYWQAQIKEYVVADVLISISVRIWPTIWTWRTFISQKTTQRNNLCQKLRVFLSKGGK